jgi:hypothetical protein
MRSHNAPNCGRIGACPHHQSEERIIYKLHIGALLQALARSQFSKKSRISNMT